MIDYLEEKWYIRGKDMKMINYIKFLVNSNQKIKTFKNEHKKEKAKWRLKREKKVLLHPKDHYMNFIAALNGILKDFYLEVHKHATWIPQWLNLQPCAFEFGLKCTVCLLG